MPPAAPLLPEPTLHDEGAGANAVGGAAAAGQAAASVGAHAAVGAAVDGAFPGPQGQRAASKGNILAALHRAMALGVGNIPRLFGGGSDLCANSKVSRECVCHGC